MFVRIREFVNHVDRSAGLREKERERDGRRARERKKKGEEEFGCECVVLGVGACARQLFSKLRTHDSGGETGL